MDQFTDSYRKQLEQETEQFLFLSNKRDNRIMFGRYSRKNMPEYVRLACIVLVFGYRRIFLRIVAKVDKHCKQFTDGLDALNGNFAMLEAWVTTFINCIKDDKIKSLCVELWEGRKAEFDKVNFSVKQLM